MLSFDQQNARSIDIDEKIARFEDRIAWLMLQQDQGTTEMSEERVNSMIANFRRRINEFKYMKMLNSNM